MGIEDNTSGNRNRWKTARERNRLKARYEIQSRIASVCSQNTAAAVDVVGSNRDDVDDVDDIGLCDGGDKNSTGSRNRFSDDDSRDFQKDDKHCYDNRHAIMAEQPQQHGDRVEQQHEQINKLSSLEEKQEDESLALLARYLEAIIQNDVSVFSTVNLSRHGELLTRPLPDCEAAAAGDEKDVDDVRKSFNNLLSTTKEMTASTATTTISTTINWKTGQKQHRQKQQQQITERASGDKKRPPRKQQQNHLQPITLATSKYGHPYVTHRLLPYLRYCRPSNNRHQTKHQTDIQCNHNFGRNCGHQCNLHHSYRCPSLTMLEYASLTGRHTIAASLLFGGVDPTVGGGVKCSLDRERQSNCHPNTRIIAEGNSSETYHTGQIKNDHSIHHINRRNNPFEMCPSLEEARKKVLSTIHSYILHQNIGDPNNNNSNNSNKVIIPLSMWSHILRSVIEMRINGVLLQLRSRDINKSKHNCNADENVVNNDPIQIFYNKNNKDRNQSDGFHRNNDDDDDGEVRVSCHHCNHTRLSPKSLVSSLSSTSASSPSSTSLVCFGPPCNHIFCETLLWIHLMQSIPNGNLNDYRRDVITCPICHSAFEGFQYCSADGGNESLPRDDNCDETPNWDDFLRNTQPSLPATRERRRMQSLQRFLSLPETSVELKQISNNERRSAKSKSKRKKTTKKRDDLHGTWYDALMPLLGQCRQVRMDRFYNAITARPPFFIPTCLHHGMDVNVRNEYGQSPLYIACWKVGDDNGGNGVQVIRMLLEYGADATQCANGGLTCVGIARRRRRLDIIRLLERYHVGLTDRWCGAGGQHFPWWMNNGDSCGGKNDETIVSGDEKHLIRQHTGTNRTSNGYKVTMLINPTLNHPGAGACTVDNAVSESDLDRLDALYRLLPVSDDDDNTYNGDDGNNGPLVGNSPKEDEHDNGNDIENTKNDKKSNFHGDKSKTKQKYRHRPTRSYYCDAEGQLQDMLMGCIAAAREAIYDGLRDGSNSDATDNSFKSNPEEANAAPPSIYPHVRFLHYRQKGSRLPPHVDLCRVDDVSGRRSTHTFILYLTDGNGDDSNHVNNFRSDSCGDGYADGETALLSSLKEAKVMAISRVKRGRALIFSHLCPHMGMKVNREKILLRGEICLG